MLGESDWLSWLLILSIPLGLALAAFWAHGRRKRKAPRIPPGDPGNPV